MFKTLIAIGSALLIYMTGFSQALGFTAVQGTVDFSRTLKDWDGFGSNCAKTAHTSDMEEFRQEYGGFSLLDEYEKQEKYVYLGALEVSDGMVLLDAPSDSVTTFFTN